MLLPNVKEKLSTISLRKKVLVIILGILVLIFFVLVIEVVCCFRSVACLLNLSRSFPQVTKLTGVKETDLAYRKSNYSYNKQLSYLSVSGKIIGVENNRVTIKTYDGSEKTFFVKTGSSFVIFDSTLAEVEEDLGKKLVFDGNNLSEIISPENRYLIAPVDFSNSEIFSNFFNKKGQRKVPIVIFMQ